MSRRYPYEYSRDSRERRVPAVEEVDEYEYPEPASQIQFKPGYVNPPLRPLRRRSTTNFVERQGDWTRVTTKPTNLPFLTANEVQGQSCYTTAPELRGRDRYYPGDRAPQAPRKYTGEPLSRARRCAGDVIIENQISSDDDDRSILSASDAGSDNSYDGFKLSLRRKGYLGGGLRPGFTSEPSETDGEKEAAVATPVVQPTLDKGNTHTVLWSRYTSGAFGRGEFMADLKLGREPNIDKKKILPGLFRWIHLESPMMNFSSFLDSAVKTAGLNDHEKQDISALLERTREAYEKPLRTSQGVSGRYLEPIFIQESTYEGLGPKRKRIRNVSFLCLPYFALEKYSSLSLPNKSLAHPMRTLLQSHYTSSPKKRDMQQAVRRLGYTPDEYCFHVPQLWCLVLNDTLLITCARLPSLGLQGKYITTQSIPRPLGGSPITHLQVSDGGNRIWLLPLDECETWLAFSSAFAEVTYQFEQNFQVSLNGTAIPLDDWPTLHARARKSQVRVSLTRKDRVVAITNSDSGDETSAVDSAHSDKEDKIGDAGPSGKRRGSSDPIIISPPPNRAPEEISGAPRPGRGPPRVVRYTRESPLDQRKQPQQVMQRDLSEFHVFTWLFVSPPETEPTPATPRDTFPNSKGWTKATGNKGDVFEVDEVDEQELQSTLSDMHEFLSNNKNIRERNIYKKCRPRTLKEVEDRLNSFESTQEVDDRLKSSNDEQRTPRRAVNKTRRKLLELYKEVFQFFFPLDIESRIILKFWGGVYRSLESKGRHIEYISDIGWIKDVAKEIKENLSDGRGPKAGRIMIPENFAKAWIHCVMYCLLSPQGHYGRSYEAGTHATRCKDLLQNGNKELRKGLMKSSIQDKEAVLPLGLMSLVIDKLLQDATNGYPDLSSTYYEYWVKIQADFQAHPYDRSHQERVSSLVQEIAIIIKNLDAQLQVLTDLLSTMGRSGIAASTRCRPYYGNKAPKEREYSIILNAISSTNAKRQSFNEMAELANELAALNIQMIASNKDRQEAAILVFTIVTIIFLPLSFISSFLGMNTYDIRNMSSKQPLFWVIALPLTFFIVGVAVLAAGEAQTVVRALQRFWSRISSGGRGRIHEPLGDGGAVAGCAGRFGEQPVLFSTAPAQTGRVYLQSPAQVVFGQPPPPQAEFAEVVVPDYAPSYERKASRRDRVRRCYR